MYRRIEVTEVWDEVPQWKRSRIGSHLMSKKCGAFCFQYFLGSVIPSLAWDMRAPNRKFKDARAKFFFTEKGWQKYGKHILADLLKAGLTISVIKIKERSADVVYKDKWQVALRRRDKKKGI